MASIIDDIVIIGHVDHGKSTLLGRIWLDHGRVPVDKVERVQSACKKKGIEFEPAFLLDALKEEQEQGISIDTTRIQFQHAGQNFSIIDCPGHIDFLKNMASGASAASLAILIVDVSEGVRPQTESHLRVLSILGISKVVVAINKMDTVQYNQSAFEATTASVRQLIEQSHLQCVDTVPISALADINIGTADKSCSWYSGLPLVPLICKQAASHLENGSINPLRIVLQDVYKFGTERHFVGKVTEGTLTTGSEVFFSPSGKMSKVLSIINANGLESTTAYRGDSVAMTLDTQIFVERGEVISQATHRPIVDTEFVAKIVWLSTTPMAADKRYILKVGTNQCLCSISPEGTQTLSSLQTGEVASVTITPNKILAFDINGTALSHFVLCTEFETVAAGLIVAEVQRQHREMQTSDTVLLETGFVGRDEHEQVNSHKGGVLWLTGLSGAGKSSLARALERRLFSAGVRCMVLDADNLRKGICADLGFSPADRSENVRRIAHAAKLFLDAGFIAIVACISPYKRDRQEARTIIGEDSFNEVFVFCPIEVCAARDSKGLYKRQKQNEVLNLTGINAPYQPPDSPDARFDSSSHNVNEGVQQLLELLKLKQIIDVADWDRGSNQ